MRAVKYINTIHVLLAYLLRQSTMSQIRAQKKNQNARQAMVISGLNTIYRTSTMSHAIKSHRQTEPRVYFLNISLDDVNKTYSKIRQTIEKWSGVAAAAAGNARYIVKTKTEHLLLTETDIYEVGLSKPTADKGRDRDRDRDRDQQLHIRVPVDGNVTIKELKLKVSAGDGDGEPIDYNIPVLIDESYYELNNISEVQSVGVI